MPKTPVTVIALAIVAMFCSVVGGVVALVIFAPQGTDFAAIISPLLGSLGATVAVILALAGRMDAIDRKVDFLANGGTDAKIRAGIADVVREDLLKPDVNEQLEADRAHRDAGPNGRN